jgi:uncharacterized membrane protein
MRLPLLILHILAGTVGLLSGTFAIAVRKGSRLHRASGNIFTVAMLTLASSALCLAIMKSQHGNILGSIITFYMITTAWLAGRRRGIGRLDLAATRTPPLPCASSWQPSSCSPPPETSACSHAEAFPAGRESRVTYGACASASSSLQAPFSSASNRSFPLSCAAPSF